MQEERRSALLAQSTAVVEIPERAEWQGNNMGGAAVQFQQHPDSAALDAAPLPSLNKQPPELWGNQAGPKRSRPESQGLISNDSGTR